MQNDDKPRFENQIISKKNHRIDEEDQPRKKGKKNKKNHQQTYPESKIEQTDRITEPKEKGRTHVTKPNNPQNDEKIFNDLCSVLSQYKQGTILKMLQKTDFDKEEAYNQLLMIPPDNEKEEEDWKKDMVPNKYNKKSESEDKSTSSTPSQNANMLMNEVFDTLLKEEINGREFEELFQEIAEMIQEDQKEKGVGMIEINDFVEECNVIKQTLLVGFREELSNFDDFEFDETSPLYSLLQEFIQDIITKQIKQEKKKDEDFPSLDHGPGNQKNIVEKIKLQNRYKKQQQQFFTPNKNSLPAFAKEKHNEMSIFNVDSNYGSEKDLISLHKEFQDVPIIDLKFIYKTLAGDYNKTIEFLIKHYDPKKNHRKVVQEIKTITYSKPAAHLKKMHSNHMREEEIDEEVQHLTYDEVREQIDHLYKLRQAFQLTKMKIKNVNQRKELDRIGNTNEPFIRKLAKASRVLLIQSMIAKDPLYVDLHGYREEEVYDLMDSIARMINEQANIGNERIKIRTIRGRRTACLIVMTGKGIHSKGHRSVLKPAISSWCTDNRIDVEEETDHMKVYMVIQ